MVTSDTIEMIPNLQRFLSKTPFLLLNNRLKGENKRAGKIRIGNNFTTYLSYVVYLKPLLANSRRVMDGSANQPTTDWLNMTPALFWQQQCFTIRVAKAMQV